VLVVSQQWSTRLFYAFESQFYLVVELTDLWIVPEFVDAIQNKRKVTTCAFPSVWTATVISVGVGDKVMK
jgi:hypothetical protein